MIAITTSSSISVNADRQRERVIKSPPEQKEIRAQKTPAPTASRRSGRTRTGAKSVIQSQRPTAVWLSRPRHCHGERGCNPKRILVFGGLEVTRWRVQLVTKRVLSIIRLILLIPSNHRSMNIARKK